MGSDPIASKGKKMKKVIVSLCALTAFALVLVGCQGLSNNTTVTNPCAPYTYCVNVTGGTGYEVQDGVITGNLIISTSPVIPSGDPVALLFGGSPGEFWPTFGAAGVSDGSGSVTVTIAGTYNGCLPSPTYLSLLVNNVNNTVGATTVDWNGTGSCAEAERHQVIVRK